MRDPNYLGYIRTLPCLICGIHRSEAAHTGPHGLSQKSCDYSAIPLCARCHRGNADSNHALGRNWAAHHGIDLALAINQFKLAFATHTRTAISPATDPIQLPAEYNARSTKQVDSQPEIFVSNEVKQRFARDISLSRHLKTVILLDHRLMAEADDHARRIGVSRSRLFSLLLDNYFRHGEFRSASTG